MLVAQASYCTPFTDIEPEWVATGGVYMMLKGFACERIAVLYNECSSCQVCHFNGACVTDFTCCKVTLAVTLYLLAPWFGNFTCFSLCPQKFLTFCSFLQYWGLHIVGCIPSYLFIYSLTSPTSGPPPAPLTSLLPLHLNLVVTSQEDFQPL